MIKNKERIAYVIAGFIVAIVTSTITAYAATSYLYNADEVTYSTSNTEIVSTDVQGAIDELYTRASEYTSLINRVTTLENGLPMKTVNSTTINNTAGSFAFTGSGDPWPSTDWVGLQIGDANDKFQLSISNSNLMFRQNDSGGTNTSWQSWYEVFSKNNVKYNTTVQTFPSDGKLSLSFSSLGISSRPNTMLLTSEFRGYVTLTYLYDESSSNVVIYAYNAGTSAPYSGAMRFAYIIFPN